MDGDGVERTEVDDGDSAGDPVSSGAAGEMRHTLVEGEGSEAPEEVSLVSAAVDPLRGFNLGLGWEFCFHRNSGTGNPYQRGLREVDANGGKTHHNISASIKVPPSPEDHLTLLPGAQPGVRRMRRGRHDGLSFTATFASTAFLHRRPSRPWLPG